MKGFRQFVEKEDPEKFVSTVKKQLDIPKRIWLGMPLTISNTKIGKQMITSPTMFHVTDFDDVYVTLASIANPGHEHDGEPDYEDPDDEIEMDTDNVRGKFEITINKKDFYKLLEPQISQGTDMGMMGGF